MSVDKDTVNKIARLSRIAISEQEAEKMVGELNGILAWVEQLGEVDVTGVEPMTAVIPNHAAPARRCRHRRRYARQSARQCPCARRHLLWRAQGD